MGLTIMAAQQQAVNNIQKKKKRNPYCSVPHFERFLSKIRNDESVTNNKSRMTGVRQYGCDRQKQQASSCKTQTWKKTYGQNTNSILSRLFIFMYHSSGRTGRATMRKEVKAKTWEHIYLQVFKSRNETLI